MKLTWVLLNQSKWKNWWRNECYEDHHEGKCLRMLAAKCWRGVQKVLKFQVILKSDALANSIHVLKAYGSFRRRLSLPSPMYSANSWKRIFKKIREELVVSSSVMRMCSITCQPMASENSKWANILATLRSLFVSSRWMVSYVSRNICSNGGTYNLLIWQNLYRNRTKRFVNDGPKIIIQMISFRYILLILKKSHFYFIFPAFKFDNS